MNPEVYILKNENLEVHISTLGATICHLVTLNSAGKPVDVVLGMEKTEDYCSPAYVASGAYLGAGIGRYANRIANGRFTLDDKVYGLAVNNGPNHLHGGICGFDKKIWEVKEYAAESLRLHYVSPDGEENYPGTLTVDIAFEVSGKELKIHYQASTDKPCFVNLTHHPYFNLDPEGVDVQDHCLKLFTHQYLRTEDLIPDGSLVEMTGNYDFTSPRPLRGVIEHCGGLDDCFIFPDDKKLRRQAELYCEKSGIRMYVCSDYPGLQVYTGRYLNVVGARGGQHYGAYAGVALEAQFWPDSPNHPDFPSTLLRPGEKYERSTVFGFE